jgi:phosphate transport system permease protein
METTLRGDRLPRLVIAVIAGIGVAVMLFILLFLVKESYPILLETPVKELFLSTQWYPTDDPPEFGMLSLIAGSLSVTLLASLLAVPVSLFLAVFLSEVCPSTLREVLKPVVEILGFFPSVVLGFIGMVIIAPWMVSALNVFTGLNLLNASILMGIMIVPIVASLAEDSLGSVPKDLRDASYALGATRLETITRVVIPAALPGILQAVLLGVMRAVGETMVVLMAAGGAAIIPMSLTDPVRPLTSAIAAEMGETPVGTAHYHALFFAGLLLLFMTLALNLIALQIEKRGRRWR